MPKKIVVFVFPQSNDMSPVVMDGVFMNPSVKPEEVLICNNNNRAEKMLANLAKKYPGREVHVLTTEKWGVCPLASFSQYEINAKGEEYPIE